MCREMGMAKKDGADVEGALRMRTRVSMLETVGKSTGQVASGLRSWAAFCDALGRRAHFPATEDDVMLYTGIFRCGQTLGNYLGHLKLAHRLLGEEVTFDTHRVRTASRGAKKTLGPMRRLGMAIQSPLATRLVRLALSIGENAMAVAIAWAHNFLLRVGDECVPLRMAGPQGGGSGEFEHSQVTITGEMVKVVLKTRKSRPRGSVMERRCTCDRNRWLCPCHVGGDWWQGKKAGDRAFPGMSYASFLRSLRRLLLLAQVRGAQAYGSHAFRRGAARDLWASSRSVAAVLAAGEWSSGAFLKHLQSEVVGDEMAINAICCAGEDDAA